MKKIFALACIASLFFTQSLNYKMVARAEVTAPVDYTLTEVTPSDVNNLEPDVLKYYDASAENKTRYFKITFNTLTHGDGASEKYYKWTKDEHGIKLTETANAAESVLTVKSSGEFEKIYNPPSTTLNNVSNTYTGGEIKNLVDNRGTLNTVSSEFTGNTVNINTTDTFNYSAVLSEVNARIGTVNSSFIGNTATVNYTGSVYGVLVKALGDIGDISSEFVANSVYSSGNNILSAVIEAGTSAEIGNISSKFLLNRVKTETSSIYGGVISNEGRINKISNSEFVGNYAVSDSGDIYGGAIQNADGGTVGVVSNSIFEGNYAESDSGNVHGGAISNQYVIDIENSKFTNNYVKSNSGEAKGGAIYTDTDMKISANNGKQTLFSGNYVENN